MKLAKKIIFGFFKPFYGKIRFQKLFNILFYISLAGRNIGEGGDFKDSGEKNALEFLRRHVFGNKPVIFDVGANIGGYTKDILEIIPNAKIHCFEPSQYTFQLLSDNLKSFNVIVNNYAVGDVETEMILYSNKNGSGLASLYKRQLDYYGDELSVAEKVRVITIDDYCDTNKIEHIDFLKMDIEGNEYNALKGATKLLNKRAISAIQIEFGGADLDSRVFFRDYWNMLHNNYYVYRICKDGLYQIMKYEETLELFACTNYMFIAKEG